MKQRPKQSKFPEGWSEGRVKAVLARYESQGDSEAIAEDEAGVAPAETEMNIPRDLVPVVRQLIAKRRNP